MLSRWTSNNNNNRGALHLLLLNTGPSCPPRVTPPTSLLQQLSSWHRTSKGPVLLLCTNRGPLPQLQQRGTMTTTTMVQQQQQRQQQQQQPRQLEMQGQWGGVNAWE